MIKLSLSIGEHPGFLIGGGGGRGLTPLLFIIDVYFKNYVIKSCR